MLYFRKANGYYCLQYKDISGKRKTVTLKDENGNNVTDKKTASQLADKTLDEYRKILHADTLEKHAAQVAEYRGILKRNLISLENVWDSYLKNPSRPDSSKGTLGNYNRIWSKFQEWLSANYPQLTDMGQIDESIAQEYSIYIWAQKISANTYKYKIGALRLIFRILSDNSSLALNPWNCISRKSEQKISRKELSEEQVLKVLDCFDDENLQLMHKNEMKVMFQLGAWTGLRLADCVLMEWASIDLKNGKIHCTPRKTAHKTNRMVTIPIHPSLKIALEEANQWKQNEALLPELAERYRYNPSGVRKDALKVFTFCGFKTTAEETSENRKLRPNLYGFHSFRHSFVSFCAKAGVPLPVFQSIAGHGNPAITRHYVHLGEESIKQAIKALPEANFKGNSTLEISSEQKLLKIRKILDKKSNLDQYDQDILKILDS